MLSQLKKTCKRLVGAADEEEVPVISTRDWAEGLVQDPARRVRASLRRPRTTWCSLFSAGGRLCYQSLSYLQLDQPL